MVGNACAGGGGADEVLAGGGLWWWLRNQFAIQIPLSSLIQ